jgi:hypothetical protein
MLVKYRYYYYYYYIIHAHCLWLPLQVSKSWSEIEVICKVNVMRGWKQLVST